MRPYLKPVKSASEQLNELFSKPNSFLIEAYPYQSLMRLPFSQRLDVMRRQLATPRPPGRKNPAKALDIPGRQGHVRARFDAEANNRMLNDLNPLVLGAQLLEEAVGQVADSATVDVPMDSSDVLAAMVVSEIGAAGEIVAHVLDDAICTNQSGSSHW